MATLLVMPDQPAGKRLHFPTRSQAIRPIYSTGFWPLCFVSAIALGIHLIGYRGKRNFDEALDQPNLTETREIAP
jgi:hypothetical protein